MITDNKKQLHKGDVKEIEVAGATFLYRFEGADLYAEYINGEAVSDKDYTILEAHLRDEIEAAVWLEWFDKHRGLCTGNIGAYGAECNECSRHNDDCSGRGEFKNAKH